MNLRAAGFALAGVVCVALYWPGLVTWFSMDDFAWLGLRLAIDNGSDLLAALFSPKAQGTIRPLSERLYFLTLEKLFGLESLPFRAVAFSVQLLNLWLVQRLVERVTGERAAGVLTALLWTVNSALALAMSWSSAFNQLLWPCLMLAGCHARWTWLETGSRRARWTEWACFLLGFGALELQVVYPVIAAALTLLYRRDRWRELLPFFAVSAAYTALNRAMAQPQTNPVYLLYWDSGLIATFGAYLRMATGLWRPEMFRPADSWWVAAEVTIALAAVAASGWLAWKRDRWALFGAVWFLATLAPILPLKNHISDYYLTVPVLGLAMAFGAAAARRPAWAVLPALLYAAGSGYWARRTVEFNYNRAEQGRLLFAGIREASQLHPGKLILLTSVSSDQYWGVMNDNPFRLVPGLRVYLAPGADENIEKHPDLGDPAGFVLPGQAARKALDSGLAVVYTPAGGKLRNVTSLWRELAARQWGGELATFVDVAQPVLASQLISGWYSIEQTFRWSAGRAMLRLGPPAGATRLTLDAFRGGEGGKRGNVTVIATVNGVATGRWEMPRDDSALTVSAPLPASIDRASPIDVELHIAPVLREDGPGGRELGLAFGKIGLR